MKISFIGYGNMAKAIVRGLTAHKEFHLHAAAPSLVPGINQNKVFTHYDNKKVIENADVIILAVKPLQMRAVLAEIAPLIPTDCLLISIAAGLSLNWLGSYCHPHQAIIRTMPNTPAAIGLGATPLCASQYSSEAQKQITELIFTAIGITTWVVNEHDMDSFTALSGSGPAYVFLFLEALIQAAVTFGLEEVTAKKFALQTVEGALKLAKNSDLSLSELRTQVTSPGGTTAAAVNELHHKLDKLIQAAMDAAKNRAHELGITY